MLKVKKETDGFTTDPMTITVGVSPQQQEQMTSAQNYFVSAQEFTVDSNASFEVAADELKAIKSKIKELDSDRKAITKPLDETKKRIMDLYRKPLAFLTQAETYLKRSMLSFQQEQEKLRRAEEAKRQELARKEQERLQKRADQAAASGKSEKAEMLQEQADTVPTPMVYASKPQTSGISTRKTWYAEVTDSKALLQAVLDGRAPISVVSINMQVLNKMAVALKNEMNYPGVVAKVKEDIAART